RSARSARGPYDWAMDSVPEPSLAPRDARRSLRAGRLVAVVLSSLLLGGTTRRAASEPAAEGPTVEIPAGIPIALGGVFRPPGGGGRGAGGPAAGGGDDAAAVVPASSGVEIRMKHSRGTLLLALRLGRPWKPTWQFHLYAV